ncbi:unnamed protein product [Zymoseptoria tritici ST99CH_1A5]|nr:unnamed protein product [Zymoseptoria tritici ST99CH_1E4]SMR47343.1 unnamed protein product [Zymoseptoria tritici ST99CH_3D1]SMY21241.1 unnamed protein product [Zymoseptoria tritici ST99CH_1A5]
MSKTSSGAPNTTKKEETSFELMHKESAKMAEMSPREQAASMASGFQILVEDLSAQLADEKKKSATAAEEYKLQTETSTAKLAERDRKCLDLQCQIRSDFTQYKENVETLRNEGEKKEAALKTMLTECDDDLSVLTAEHVKLKENMESTNELLPKLRRIAKAAKSVAINNSGRDWNEHGRRLAELADAVKASEE